MNTLFWFPRKKKASTRQYCMGIHRVPRIVGWIHIHVASSESLGLSMLHNRVCLSRSDFFHPFFSIVESYLTIYIWWDSFQYHYATIDYHHHLVWSMTIAGGTHLFGGDVRGGATKSPGALVFRGAKHTLSTNFWGRYRDPIKVRTFFMFFLDLFIMFNRGGSLRLWLVHHVRPRNA